MASDTVDIDGMIEAADLLRKMLRDGARVSPTLDSEGKHQTRVRPTIVAAMDFLTRAEVLMQNEGEHGVCIYQQNLVSVITDSLIFCACMALQI